MLMAGSAATEVLAFMLETDGKEGVFAIDPDRLDRVLTMAPEAVWDVSAAAPAEDVIVV